MGSRLHRSVSCYMDSEGNAVYLTESEKAWFDGKVEIAKRATGCTLDVVTRDNAYDHNGDCLAFLNTNDVRHRTDPRRSETFIVVDTAFISEAYRHEITGQRITEDETMLHLLAHEIAHLRHWRHTAKHAALTEELHDQMLTYEREMAS